MKLLFVSACGSREGDINHALLVLSNLPADIEVVVATLPRGPVREFLSSLPNLRVLEDIEMGGSELSPKRRLPGAAGELLEFVGGFFSILALARRESVDVVCSIDRTVSAYHVALLSVLLKRPFLLISAYSLYGHFRAINRRVLRRASLIISHSEFLTFWTKPYVPDPGRIVTIPDPVEIEKYTPGDPAQAELRATWDIPPGGAVVMLAGRINRYKGHDNLVRAAKIIAETRPDTRILFCGRPDAEMITIDGHSGTFASHVERLIDELDVSTQVKFLGYVPNLATAMGAADIITMPSLQEPYGLVALEGMAIGKPVVATRAGGVPEFVIDGETGILIESSEPTLLAAALLTLIDDPEGARVLGRRARAHVEAGYTAEIYMARFVPALRGLVGDFSHPPAPSLASERGGD